MPVTATMIKLGHMNEQSFVTTYATGADPLRDLAFLPRYQPQTSQHIVEDMSTGDGGGAGICILSLDNGGPGTYSQLLLLKEYMRRIASDRDVDEDDVYPADHFDLMGGVGFGGFAALLLGYLRMNVNTAIDAVISVAMSVFPIGSGGTLEPETNSNNLKQAIEDILQASNVPLDTKIYDKNTLPGSCKVALYAAASANMSHSQIFRTYSSGRYNLNPTIVESICATLSIPSLFLPVKIGPRLREQNFAGGAIGGSNPTRELLKEAGEAFAEDKRVAQVISLGSGLSRPISLQSPGGITEALRAMSADCEGVASELSTRLYNVDAYLRLNVARGMEDILMTDWGDLGAIETHTSAYLATATVTRALEASLQRLKHKVGTVTLRQFNHSSSVKVMAKTVPAVSAYHVVRADSALMVYHLVVLQSSQQKIFAITGMGGCGKTQMVSYFLQENPLLYKHTVFVDASSSSSIQTDLQVWAQSRGDGHEHDVWEDGLRTLSSDPDSEGSVLILDNADDPSLEIVPYFPKNKNVTIILTSRNRNLGKLSTTYHLELGEMGKDEALSTLLRASRRDLPLSAAELESAHTLVRELGSLAVALVQAGGYCYEMSSRDYGVLQPFTFTQYLSLFHLHRAKLMRRAEPASLDRYQKGAYTTLDISYAALPPDAREFLHFLSFFHHTNIPLAAIAANADSGFQDLMPYCRRPESHAKVVFDLKQLLCSDEKWNELKVHETIRNLRSFSLVSTPSIDDTIFLQLHPLIQAWSRDMVCLQSPHYKAMVMHALTSSTGRNILHLYRYILPHIIDMLDQNEGHRLHLNDLMASGRLFNEQGQYANASRCFKAALQVTEDAPDEVTLEIASWLAKSYNEEGKWREAEELRLEVLRGQKSALGANHLITIDAAAQLGASYQSQGRWKDAEKLQEDVLERRSRILGNRHTKTIDAAASLAITYSGQERLVHAEKLELAVLTMTRSILGRSHLDSIMAAAQLAVTYYQQRRFKDAEELQVEVLDQRRKMLGPEHPETLRTAANLANTYSAQGRILEAQELLVDVLELLRRTRGVEHRETILAESNLAGVYCALGQLDKATALIQSSVRLSLKVMGVQHPNTQRFLTNAVVFYVGAGRHSDAERMRALLISTNSESHV